MPFAQQLVLGIARLRIDRRDDLPGNRTLLVLSGSATFCACPRSTPASTASGHRRTLPTHRGRIAA